MVVPLLVKDLRKDYLVKGKVTSALRGLSLTASRPMILSILGRNGSGKTTFVKIATGQLIPGSGTVEIFGHDVISSPASVKGLISLVPQECRPWGHMTPREHIYHYQRILGNSREGARDRVQFISDMLRIGSFMDTEAVNLSGGQRQLIVVGMSLSAEADIYFLDEPTIGLDVITRKNVWEGIRYFRKLGKTIVLTTHYLDEASALSDEIAVVSEGRLLAQGTLQQLQNMLDYNTRIRIPAGFAKGSLEPYGKVVSESQYEILYTDEKRVEEIILSAGLLKTRIEIGPVGLDDVFISLVGGSIED
ncbi:MAG: ABC transporter ATP-binding protein [Candidatus Thermoplasmatota archaeon]|jgi:ABC-2 type transport system ATP-binding protein|nr:ABC transporter ATP-binding protein [Candidatus Thermoplasmatota archaeon]MCL5799971.1 ABC transporter ATP-binding protein [Candidatus Thermoplasmatota archaeon]